MLRRCNQILFACAMMAIIPGVSYAQWKDMKTGKVVPSGPIVGNVPVYGSYPQPNGPPGFRTYTGEHQSGGTLDIVRVAVRPSETDPTRAYDPESGRNFYRDPCPPAQHASSTPPPPAPLDTISGQLLATHNKLRAEVGSPPLQWDPELAAAAAAYARQLASGAPYIHSPRQSRENQRENLSQGLLGASPEWLMGVWTKEKKNLIPGVYPNVSRTGDWNDISHYTQMTWPTTTRIGCGIANGNARTFMVCRYSPPGNQPGMQVVANTEFRLGLQWKFGGEPIAPYQETQVGQPQLPNKEAFKPEPSKEPLEDPL